MTVRENDLLLYRRNIDAECIRCLLIYSDRALVRAEVTDRDIARVLAILQDLDSLLTCM